MKRKDDLHPLELMADGVSRSGVNLIVGVDLTYGPTVEMGVEVTDALAACASTHGERARGLLLLVHGHGEKALELGEVELPRRALVGLLSLAVWSVVALTLVVAVITALGVVLGLLLLVCWGGALREPMTVAVKLGMALLGGV